MNKNDFLNIINLLSKNNKNNNIINSSDWSIITNDSVLITNDSVLDDKFNITEFINDKFNINNKITKNRICILNFTIIDYKFNMEDNSIYLKYIYPYNKNMSKYHHIYTNNILCLKNNLLFHKDLTDLDIYYLDLDKEKLNKLKLVLSI